MHVLRHARGVAARVVLAVALLFSVSLITPPHGGAQAAEAQAAGGKDAKKQIRVKQGDSCKRKTDNAPGVVKQDGCGRWYCGRADVKDITELVPNIEDVAQCKWHLEGQRCFCRKLGTAPNK